MIVKTQRVKTILRSTVSNQRGSALVNALIFSGMMMVASGVMMYQSLQTQQLSRMPRVRSEIDRIEARVREIALDPTTYSGCKTVDSSSADIPNTCTINQSLMTDLDSRIAGCKKADGSSCGIKITNISLDNATGVFKAEINYEGKEMPLRPSRIEMPIPKDILQADVVYCPLDKPLFRGFDAKGKLICEALKNPELCNLPGQYIKDIDALNFSVSSCSSLSAVSDGCPANQYMSSFSWPGGPTFIKQCADRKDPWVLFNYTPVTNTGDAKSNGFLPLAALTPASAVSEICTPIVVTPSPAPTVVASPIPTVGCKDTKWTPLPSTVCLNTTFEQTSNCGNSRDSLGTKDCTVVDPPCVDNWTPDASTVCLGISFTQISDCKGHTQSATGTKDCTVVEPPCVSTGWSPSESTVCSGISFTQTSDNCRNQSQNAVGTKDCTPICIPKKWTPDPSTVCSGESFIQTGDCAGSSQSAVGTKDCCVPTWSPDPSTVCSGVSFSQSPSCGTGLRPATGTMNCVVRPSDCGAPAVTYVPDCNTGDSKAVTVPCGGGQVPACRTSFQNCGPGTDSVSRIYYDSCYCKNEPACK